MRELIEFPHGLLGWIRAQAARFSSGTTLYLKNAVTATAPHRIKGRMSVLQAFETTGRHTGRSTAERMMCALFNSALWAMVIALCCFKWTWLEMRFNVGWIFYGVWIIAFALIVWRVPKPLGFKFSVINTVVSLVIGLVVCRGVTGILLIPACVIREGVGFTTWNIDAINVTVFAFMAICLLIIAILEFAGPRKRSSAC